MFVLFCVFYLITLIMSGYAFWMISRTGLTEMRLFILVCFILFQCLAYVLQGNDILLLTLTIIYGVIVFQVIYRISVRVIELKKNK